MCSASACSLQRAARRYEDALARGGVGAWRRESHRVGSRQAPVQIEKQSALLLARASPFARVLYR